MAPTPAKPRVPPTIVATAIAVIAGAAALAVAGAVSVGVTWDERVQVYMLQVFFDTGWHTGAPLIDGVPDPAYYFGTYVYGPVGELLPHTINVILGGADFWSTSPVTPEAYAGRHLGVAIWGFIGIAATGASVAILTRSWRWGLLGAAILGSTPLWTGHSMFNIKDIPAATGYTLFTLGFIALLDRDYFAERRLRITSLLLLTLGLVVAIGTRTALFLPLVLTFVAAWLFVLLIRWRQSSRGAEPLRVGRRIIEGLGTYLAAYGILVLLYPKAYLNPIEVGAKSILDSALYPVYEAQLVAGNWLIQPVDWTYQPMWFAAQLPLLSLIPFISFVVWWLIRTAQLLVRSMGVDLASRTQQTLPVLLQVFVVPVGAIVGSSTLYNGTRQMLFVPPAVVILATIGLYLFVKWWRLAAKRGLRIGTWSLVVAGLITPMFAQMQLFPYGYTFFNAPTSLQTIDGNWPTDYWRASGREILRNLPAGGLDSCGFEQLMKGEIFPCTEQPMFEPFLQERGRDAPAVQLADNEYWFIRENSGPLEIPPGCRAFTEINRPLFWRDVTIAQIHICDNRVDTGIRNMADPEAS